MHRRIKCSWSIIWSRSSKEKDTDQGLELNFDEHFHLLKRTRIEAEDETKKIVEGLNKGGIVSANDSNGENMASR